MEYHPINTQISLKGPISQRCHKNLMGTGTARIEGKETNGHFDITLEMQQCW